MRIYELIFPGVFLDTQDREWAVLIGNLISHLEQSFHEANIAICFFAETHGVSRRDEISAEAWSEGDKVSTIRKKIIQEEGLDEYDHALQRDVNFRAEVQYNREKWASGKLPKAFISKLPSIYAKNFLLAAESIGKFLGVLSQERGVPATLKPLVEEFRATFPTLREIRNSMSHQEDRARRIGPRNQPFVPAEVDNYLAKAPAGVFQVAEGFSGNKFITTLGDGTLGEIEVTWESLEKLGSIVQRAIDAFTWSGPVKRLSPT